MSHLDDAQLDAYLAARAEFADRTVRREAGRHIADCPECSHRLKHAWSGHPESIDHPVGPAGRPSWPLLRASGPISRPSVPPRGNGGTGSRAPSTQPRRPGVVRVVPPTKESPRVAASVAAEEGDPLTGTPWPALIAALEAVLRPKAAEPAAPPLPLRRTPDGGWIVDEPPAAFEAGHGRDVEMVDHSGEVPALDLDLTSRYQNRAEQSRRRARRRQVLAAAAMLIFAVLLAGAVLKVGASTLRAGARWETPPAAVTPAAEIPSTTLFESASALQSFAESLRTAADSLDSTSATVASLLHPDVRQAINDPTWGDTARAGAADTVAPPAPDAARQQAPRSPRSETPTSAGPRLPATRRASSPDLALSTGEWQVSTAAAAERQLGHPLLLVSGLGLESIARPGNSNGAFVRIAQVTRSGDRVAIVLSRPAAPAGSPPAPPGLGAVRILPATDASPIAMAMGRWGELLVTVRAELPPDSLRAFMGRLRELRD